MTEPGQWEYWLFNANSCWDEATGSFKVPGLPDGLKTWNEVLNEVGKLRWELVAVTDRPTSWSGPGRYWSDQQMVFYFKRPRT
ncbi:hypothetical protein GCM10009662_29630 [Catellatospora coxensis]|uniref:DUF4177 domain-containing protein n=1 Tax=Catellatospora coxensis TaxID=310354 RepID=A0A8J3KXZ6_9ACTN|nr:hypothetical protein Cco03nite_74780 [Catellatospora coxensis]